MRTAVKGKARNKLYMNAGSLVTPGMTTAALMRRRGLPSVQEVESALAYNSLSEFIRQAWPYVETRPYVHNWHIDAIADHLEAVTKGQIKRLIINVPPRHMKSLGVSVFWPAWEWLHNPKSQFLFSSYAETLSIRDSVKCRRLMQHPWYQKLMLACFPNFALTGDQNTKIRFENTKGGYRLATSVEGSNTGEGGDRLVVDDPVNVMESESMVKRVAVNDWWDGVMTTRLNDAITGAKVIIMQRCHENDMVGHILRTDGDRWEMLILPARYEGKNQCRTSLNFVDPRTQEGELLYPQRFPEDEVQSLEKTLGPYRCTPYESPVLMADLSLKPIGKVKVGDCVVGFAKKERKDTEGRAKLQPARVTRVFQYKSAPVVKMILDSGEKIRCTRQHKWFTRVRGEDRESYLPVTLGRSKLARICPARLPRLARKDLRKAGWLAGFFDGDGTVSVLKRDGDYRDSVRIAFTQGAGRNLQLCQKLEKLLTHFGFSFSVQVRKVQEKNGRSHDVNQYTLLGASVPMFQRFLHIVRPTKWKNRIESGAFGAKFVQGREKVVSIKPDGRETVYGLETTTGNYVVWGLASSNSAAQLQQRPAPRSGGMFPIAKIKLVKTFDRSAIIASVRYWDKASTEGAGCQSAGVLMHKLFDSTYAVEDVQAGQWSINERNARMLQMAVLDKERCESSKVKIQTWIEREPGSGGKESAEISVKELAGHPVFCDTAKIDKEVRAEPFSSQVAGGNVSCIIGSWTDAFFGQLELFPKGTWIDQADAASGAFNKLVLTKVKRAGAW